LLRQGGPVYVPLAEEAFGEPAAHSGAMMTMDKLSRFVALIAAWFPAWALAADTVSQTARPAGNVGASGLWVLANICFAGMRAQNSPSAGWRIVSFIFGFPGTLITYFVVDEGAERAYGIEIPKKH
jgi:hypothetical protein